MNLFVSLECVWLFKALISIFHPWIQVARNCSRLSKKSQRVDKTNQSINERRGKVRAYNWVQTSSDVTLKKSHICSMMISKNWCILKEDSLTWDMGLYYSPEIVTNSLKQNLFPSLLATRINQISAQLSTWVSLVIYHLEKHNNVE